MKRFYKNKLDYINDNIKENDVVLDVGFWGQGVKMDDKNWPHKLIKNKAKIVYGLDLDFDERLFSGNFYKKANAEDFQFDIKFDVIFAGDLIEHLSNPGLFLESCKKNLKEGGRILITTPNCFNLFNFSSKITKREPLSNPDHTCYFNITTLSQLFKKNGFFINDHSFLYDLGVKFKPSIKKRFLDVIYFVLSKFTNKYLETLVVESRLLRTKNE